MHHIRPILLDLAHWTRPSKWTGLDQADQTGQDGLTGSSGLNWPPETDILHQIDKTGLAGRGTVLVNIIRQNG